MTFEDYLCQSDFKRLQAYDQARLKQIFEQLGNSHHLGIKYSDQNLGSAPAHKIKTLLDFPEMKFHPYDPNKPLLTKLNDSKIPLTTNEFQVLYKILDYGFSSLSINEYINYLSYKLESHTLSYKRTHSTAFVISLIQDVKDFQEKVFSEFSHEDMKEIVCPLVYSAFNYMLKEDDKDLNLERNKQVKEALDLLVLNPNKTSQKSIIAIFESELFIFNMKLPYQFHQALVDYTFSKATTGSVVYPDIVKETQTLLGLCLPKKINPKTFFKYVNFLGVAFYKLFINNEITSDTLKLFLKYIKEESDSCNLVSDKTFYQYLVVPAAAAITSNLSGFYRMPNGIQLTRELCSLLSELTSVDSPTATNLSQINEGLLKLKYFIPLEK